LAGVSENRRTSRWWNLQDPFTRAAIDLSIPANAKAAPSGLVADDGLPGSRADAEHRQDEPPSRHPQGLTILRPAPRSPWPPEGSGEAPRAGDGRPVECQNLHTIFCHA
jgi:hypothetical protein